MKFRMMKILILSHRKNNSQDSTNVPGYVPI